MEVLTNYYYKLEIKSASLKAPLEGRWRGEKTSTENCESRSPSLKSSNRAYGRVGTEVRELEAETNRNRKESSDVNVLLNTPPNLLKASRLFRLFAGEKPQPARIYPWEWAGEMRKSWDEFQTISAARETTSRGTKISEQTKQVCLKKGVKVEEPQTTVEQQTTRKIIKP